MYGGYGPGRPSKEAQQNKEIGEFERNNDWRGLLGYAERTMGEFNDVNWGTTFSKLGRFRLESKAIASDPRFRSVLMTLEERI